MKNAQLGLTIHLDLDVSQFDHWQLLGMSRAATFDELFAEAWPTLAPNCSYHRGLGIWIARQNYIPLDQDTYPKSTRRLLWEQDFSAAKNLAKVALNFNRGGH